MPWEKPGDVGRCRTMRFHALRQAARNGHIERGGHFDAPTAAQPAQRRPTAYIARVQDGGQPRLHLDEQVIELQLRYDDARRLLRHSPSLA